MLTKHPFVRFATIFAFPLITAALLLSLYFFRAKPRTFPVTDFYPANSDPSLVGDTSEPQFSDDVLLLSGWLIDQDGQYSGFNWGNNGFVSGPYNCSWLALLNKDSQLVYRLPTQASVPPDDLNPAAYSAMIQETSENPNYGHFFLTTKISKNQLPHGTFTVCILTQLPNGEKYILHTNREVSL